MVLLFLSFLPICSNISAEDYSLGIKTNTPYEWEVIFVHENAVQLLNYKTVGLIFDVGTRVKVIAKEIDSWPKIWELWCEKYPNPHDPRGYYSVNYVVYKIPSESEREVNLNPRGSGATIFGAKPIETYLAECSLHNSGVSSNGTTIITYHKLVSGTWDYGDEANYLYRAEGEFNTNSGRLSSVRYYLNTDDLLLQWTSVSQSISSYCVVVILACSIIGLLIVIRRTKIRLDKYEV